jgi:hypothetical protein
MKRIASALLLPLLLCNALRADSRPVEIRDVSFAEPTTPVFLNEEGEETVQISGMSLDSSGGQKWFRVTVLYDTSPEWIDRLTVAVAIQFAGERGGRVVFRNAADFVDVPAGRDHRCEMYLHFNTYARRYFRQGQIRYAVVIQLDGKTVAVETDNGGDDRWWTAKEAVTRSLLTRDQTPFAFLNAGLYEARATRPVRADSAQPAANEASGTHTDQGSGAATKPQAEGMTLP